MTNRILVISAIALTILAFEHQPSFSQVTLEWVARYNVPGVASSIALDGSGNIYVTGGSVGSGTFSDYTTVKYNSSGVQQWVASYNGSENFDDHASSVKVDGLGNVYVTGSSWGSGTRLDYATIKYNSSGVQQWVARYNGPANVEDLANSLVVDGSGNVYVTGTSASETSWDFVTIKYNSLGVQQWVERYNGPGNLSNIATSLEVDGSGNVYVTGYSEVIGPSWDYITIKYNSAGVQQWVERYNGPGNADDQGNSIAVDGSGNVYVTGNSVGSGTSTDYATIKYNSSGVQQWVARYNGPPGNSGDVANSIAVDGSGNVYATGNSYGSGTSSDYATVKYNSSGVQQWVERYNGPGNLGDKATSLEVDGSGNVYVTGYSEGIGTGTDYATIKYNSTGVQQWVLRYNGTGNASDEGNSIAVDGSGNVYVTGHSEGIGLSMNYATYATIKYSQQASQLSVISPNGGETYLNGQQVIITWNSQAVQSVKIEFTSNNGVTWSILSANYPADSGRFAWTVPNINSTQCKIKITDSNDPGIYDISNSSFTISPVTLNTGLIAYYPFNGNTNDESGNNNHGTNNGATFTTDINETQNDALDFNGISNFVSIPDFNILNNNSLTFSCIIYPRSLNTSVSVYHGFSGEIQMNTYNGNQLGVGVKLSDNNWYFSNVNALPNNWYLLTGVWVRGNSIKLYLNGLLQSQNSVPDYDLYEEHFHNSSIGAYSRFMYPSDARPFNGKIDEVRIYNRALSQSEIQKLYNKALAFTKPSAYSKWISGESDTIRWINQGWTSYDIKCLLNYGTPNQSEFIIDSFITDTSYVWNIPGSLLSFRSKIIVQNSDDVNQSIESNIFRIKPYLLTKLNADSTYYEYSIGRDNWRYENGRTNFWFEEWYNQFNYSWIDPFTGRYYPFKLFYGALKNDFPDWVSWVNAFSIDACYSNFEEGEYSPTAIAKWKAFKRRNTKYPGSCFGIALSNAMAFNHKSQFLRRYPVFPQFTNPHDVIINDNVRKITNELWTHQLGKPHKKFLNSSSFNTFPRETLDSLKDLLLQDNCIIKMLGIVNLNNSKGGAHMILPYKVERLFGAGEYSILTYDNNSPDVPQSFVIKTLENGGNGSWSSQEYNEWGGAKGIILSDDVYNYFFTPLIEQTNATSPFTVEDSLLQVYNPGNADFVIKDETGNVSGTINDSSFNNIENSIPVYSFGGFEGPPYMFNLQAGRYSVTLKNFNSDKIESYLFTGNKSFTYSRDAISSNQTDVLLFDGNITALNEDSQAKQIALSSIIKESSSEKVVQIKSLIMQQNDSVKLVNIQDEDFKLISYGAQKQYELELDYVAPSGTDRFINSNIVLSANSSHTILPEWNNISNGTLTILEDIGNNGSIDDTINLRNYSELDLVLYTFIEGLYNNVTSRMTYDTVTILLRDKHFPFAIADSANAVLSIQGKGFFTFHNAQYSTPYYLVVKHRNAIEVWSDSTIWLSANSTNSYSFVDSVSFAYGNNLIQVDSSPIRFALFSGDVNQDGAVDASDVSLIDNDATNFISGYVATDLTGDGFVDGTDFVIADNNAASFVSVIRP